MSRIVVIGGSGFLGSDFIETVGIGDCVNLDIVSPKNKKIKHVQCDISKPFSFDFMPDDIVVHLAARQYHLPVPEKGTLNFFTDVNVRGTQNILSRMEECGAHMMVYFSTDMVYGYPQFLPITESHPKNPIGEYGQSKKMAEAICAEFRQKGFNITIFRPRMIVGKGRLGILVKLFKLIKAGLPVPMIGSGNNHYQMVSVKDCSKAIIKAIERNIPNAEFNLGSKNPPKVKDLLKSLIRTNNSNSILIPTWGAGVKAAIKVFALCGIRIMYKEQYSIADKNYLLSTEFAEKELGWVPEYNDSDMMRNAFESFKSSMEL